VKLRATKDTPVEAMRGVIHIKSELGKGTCLRIEFPASLLVSKGILVAVSGQEVVLPMESIRSMVKIPQATVRTVHGQRIAPVRGAVFPVIALADALSSDPIEEKKKRPELAVAIIDAASGSYGLVVDQFLGEVEVVIKPLNGVLSKVPEYVGAAIMANARSNRFYAAVLIEGIAVFICYLAQNGARRLPLRTADQRFIRKHLLRFYVDDRLQSHGEGKRRFYPILAGTARVPAR
jgi:hypothetical protein